jgi:Tfp pilus assembly protein PilV
MRSRPWNHRGITLTEVIVSIIVVAAAMTGLASLLFGTMHANLYARRMTTAVRLAMNKIEEMRAMSYTSVESGDDDVSIADGVTNVDSSGVESTSTESEVDYEREWEVTDGPVTGTKEVAITVSWDGGEVELVTLMQD